jgi:site-specific DNA-methyltransferase (adenine-specific)
MSKTATSSFGASRRESHDASDFYSRTLHDERPIPPALPSQPAPARAEQSVSAPMPGAWVDRLYHQSATDMSALPAESVSLAFTSPPYNVGKEYDDNMPLESYLTLIRSVAEQTYRVLRPGGRYVVNIANLGRKPYIPLHAYFYGVHMEAGFLPMGEIIWRKGKGANGNCAWGSWRSARAPRLRDVHEYLLVFAKGDYSRPERGESDIQRDEFMEATLSVWDILPESAKRVGHPAPFPVELAARVIQLYSYVGDVVLDPFIGSGTTAVAAVRNNRRFVGFEVDDTYFQLAQNRVNEARREAATVQDSLSEPAPKTRQAHINQDK